MIKILIPEIVPSLNKGEAAILIGMLESFKALGDFEVTIFSVDRDVDEKRYHKNGVKVVDAREIFSRSWRVQVGGKIGFIFSFGSVLWHHGVFAILHRLFGPRALKLKKGQIWRAYCESDLVIMAHDNAFSPLYHSMLVYFFRSLKKRAVIYAASITPLRKWIEPVVRSALNKTDLITLREEISYGYLVALGVNRPVMRVTADTAFLLPYSSEAISSIMKKENIDVNQGPVVGLTACRHTAYRAFCGQGTFQARHQDHVEILARVIDHLNECLNATVVLVPHCLDPDDRLVYQEICYRVRNRSCVRLIAREYTPEEVKGIIGQLDLLIGERLHSVIDALSMHVPAIAMSFPSDCRTWGIIGNMLGQKRWLYDIEDLQFDTLVDMIDRAWSERDTIKTELRPRIERVTELALLNGELVTDTIFRVQRGHK